MTPEEKLELLITLLQRGVEVRTRYRNRRVVAMERVDSQIAIQYEDSGIEKIHLRDFGRRRFVAVI
jgi:hypothetical protein